MASNRFNGMGVSALMAVTAMVSVQTGAAVSTWMFDDTGPMGAAWLRLTCAALVLIAMCRPKARDFTIRSAGYAVALGLISCGMTICYFQAIARIPLGTASALEYLGPFVVAIVGLRSRRDVLWPVLACAGVVLVTQPWQTSFDAVGIAYGVAAGACLGGYVVLLQRVGDAFTGMQGLTLSIATAAAASSVFGFADATRAISWSVVALSVASALLLPLLPYALEMMALRRMTASALSTLMSFEPALACLIGFVLLSQHMTVLQVLGIALVITAGLGAVRRGSRTVEPEPISVP